MLENSPPPLKTQKQNSKFGLVIGVFVLGICTVLGCLAVSFGWEAHKYEQISHNPEAHIWVASPDLYSKSAGLVLTGDSGRLQAGYALLLEGKIQNLYISGVSKGVTTKDFENIKGIKGKVLTQIQNKIVLGYEATSTKSNAFEAANWFKDSDFQVILLITSSYHMPRALMLHRREMPNVVFIPYPTPAITGSEETLNARRMTIFLREFAKYLAALIGF